jgi:hypothetical protein
MSGSSTDLWLHVLHMDTTWRRQITKSPDHPFGAPGRDYAEGCEVESTCISTRAEAAEMMAVHERSRIH